MTSLRILILALAAGILIGCYVPMTFPETDADELTSPFDKINLLVDPGSIEISITDQNKDLRNLRFISATFISVKGESIPVALGKAGYPTSSGNSLHTAWFRVAFRDKTYFARGQFQLQLTTTLGATTYVISGKFSEHHRTQMINLYDALDHG